MPKVGASRRHRLDGFTQIFLYSFEVPELELGNRLNGFIKATASLLCAFKSILIRLIRVIRVIRVPFFFVQNSF